MPRQTRIPNFEPRVARIDTRCAAPFPREMNPFYSTPEWRELIDAITKERGRRCQDPECTNPNGPWSRIFGDHIVELQDNGAPLDKANILLRCGSCHTRKTIRERAKRHARQGA